MIIFVEFLQEIRLKKLLICAVCYGIKTLGTLGLYGRGIGTENRSVNMTIASNEL